MNASNAIDLTAVITTPENIQFEYRIAGPFRRLPALIIDFIVRFVIWFVAIIALSTLGFAAGGFAVLLFLILWFSIDWFYGVLFETYWSGQTPGKWLTQLRVISTDGRPIRGYQATIRNFLRLADFAPFVSLEALFEGAPPLYLIPTFLVSLICMTFTSRFQRVGDLAAGTMVVVNQRSWIPTHVRLEDPRIAALAEFIPAHFRMSATLAKTIALYVDRRNRLAPARRAELAALLAQPLMKQFGFRGDTSSDLVLCAIYYREFMSKDAFSNQHSFAPPPRAVDNSPNQTHPISLTTASTVAVAPKADGDFVAVSSDGIEVVSARPVDHATAASSTAAPPILDSNYHANR